MPFAFLFNSYLENPACGQTHNPLQELKILDYAASPNEILAWIMQTPFGGLDHGYTFVTKIGTVFVAIQGTRSGKRADIILLYLKEKGDPFYRLGLAKCKVDFETRIRYARRKHEFAIWNAEKPELKAVWTIPEVFLAQR